MAELNAPFRNPQFSSARISLSSLGSNLFAGFYPGDNYRVEFVYPHERAATLAKRTNQNVLSMKDDMKKNMATSATLASDAGIQQMQKTEVSGVNPQGDRVELTVVVATTPR